MSLRQGCVSAANYLGIEFDGIDLCHPWAEGIQRESIGVTSKSLTYQRVAKVWVMARPLRIELAGGRYHVTARGHDRRDIFLSDVAGAARLPMEQPSRLRWQYQDSWLSHDERRHEILSPRIGWQSAKGVC